MADLTLDLYRACKRNKRSEQKITKTHDGVGCLYPEYKGFMTTDRGFRAPDVTTFTDNANCEWIRGVEDIDPKNKKPYISANEGVSLNTGPGKFNYERWFYFLLPKGTPIPGSLDIIQTGKDTSHYAIRCKNMLRKDAYEGALNNLARAALAKAVELKRQSLYFS